MTPPKDATALLPLALRCETEEPSRELDDAIHDVICVLLDLTYGTPPHYTTSLDAAVTLVPEGFVWAVDNLSGARAHVLGGEDEHGNVPTGDSDAETTKTPAIALCAAALRARAAVADSPVSPSANGASTNQGDT